MYARHEGTHNLLRNDQIRIEAARTCPVFDAAEKLSKTFSYYCQHAGASLLKDDELEDWDGFLSLYEIMGASRPAYWCAGDPVFVAFVLQAIPEQRYTATIRECNRSVTLMVHIRAGCGIGNELKQYISQDRAADRLITDVSQIPIIAVAAHHLKKADSINEHGLYKDKDRNEIHLRWPHRRWALLIFLL